MQLAGGSKAHWLARAYSDALLVRADDGSAIERADLRVIVERLIRVLERAAESLRSAASIAEPSAESLGLQQTDSRRFDFVHDPDLRPVLEQAYVESRRAADERRFADALMATCGILEALVTDALVHRDRRAKDQIVSWSFDARLEAAQTAGLIRNSVARLPPVARAYRDEAEAEPIVVEGDARTTAQVLRTVMRDLDPGR